MEFGVWSLEFGVWNLEFNIKSFFVTLIEEICRRPTRNAIILEFRQLRESFFLFCHEKKNFRIIEGVSK